VINGTPEIMRLAIDPDENLVQVPAPVRIPTVMNASFPDLHGEHRTETVPPETHSLVADIDATLKQQVLDLAQRQRISNIHHHRQTDDLGRTVEIAEGVFHPRRLRAGTVSLKPFCSDNAVETVYGVIYPPQDALIGFGSIVMRPWLADGDIEPRPIIEASLAADHRASDGHRGASFLNAVNRLLQEPETL